MQPQLTKNLHSSFIGYKKRRKSNQTIAGQAAALRVRELLEFLRPYTTHQGVANCFPYRFGYPWPNAAKRLYEAGQIYPSRCGNRNACPVCARAYLAGKRLEVENALAAWERQGGEIYLQTLTIAHDAGMPTLEKYKNISQAWTAMRKRSKYKRLASELGQPAFLRIQEESLGEQGWFPHLHLIWLFRAEKTQAEIERFLIEVESLWLSSVLSTDSGRCESKGQDWRRVKRGSTLNVARYVFKHGYLDNQPVETFDYMAQKLGPFQLLAYVAETGDSDAFTFWQDFEIASRGIQRARSSKNFPWIETNGVVGDGG